MKDVFSSAIVVIILVILVDITFNIAKISKALEEGLEVYKQRSIAIQAIKERAIEEGIKDYHDMLFHNKKLKEPPLYKE